MPCGQFDKRRGGHRCAACRKSHQRCDGQLPCSNCQRRGVCCAFPRRTTRLQVVNVLSTPNKALSDTSWKYTYLAFRAAGLLPQGAVFRSDSAISLSHTDEAVHEALSIVGQLYGARIGNDGLEDERGTQISRRLAASKVLCTETMRQPSGALFGAHLLSALLLAVADLLLDETACNWRSWMADICVYVKRVTRDVVDLSLLDKELIRFCQLSDVLGSLSRCEALLAPDFSGEMLKANLFPSIGAKVPPDASYTENYDNMLSLLWQWSHWQQSLTEWVEAGPCCHDHIRGLELMSEASRLQLEVLAVLLTFSSSSDPSCRFLHPYLRWALIGMSQLLQHQNLENLDCELPIMPSVCLRDQAQTILDEVEQMVSHTTLDAAFFLPLMDTVGAVIEANDDRRRVVLFVDSVEARGIGIAREYR